MPAPVGWYRPCAHAAQLVCASLDWNSPAEQAAHSAACAAAPFLPAAHAAQAGAAAPEYFPAGHESHSSGGGTVSEYFPVGHSAQTASPVSGWR